jgi:hypothetical protein
VLEELGRQQMLEQYAEQVEATQAAWEEQNAPAIAGLEEFDRLLRLNPHLDAERAWGYFVDVPLDDPEEAKRIALMAFQTVSAEATAAEEDAKRHAFNVQAFGRGDERYYLEEYLPRLRVEDPVAYARLTRRTPVDLSFYESIDPADPDAPRTAREVYQEVKNDPQAFIARSLALIDKTTERETAKTRERAKLAREVEEYHLRTTGTRSGNPVEPGFERR